MVLVILLKKTMDFTEGQQAKIDGLLAQGYEPSTARNVLTGRDLNLRGTLNEMPAVNIERVNNNDLEGIRSIDGIYAR